MKRLVLVLSLALAALAGCAQLPESSADRGASGVEETRPYPKSSSTLGLF